MKQLIFIEGLPGTGKTATTQKLSEYFSSKGQKVITLFEGDERIPSDFMKWQVFRPMNSILSVPGIHRQQMNLETYHYAQRTMFTYD